MPFRSSADSVAEACWEGPCSRVAAAGWHVALCNRHRSRFPVLVALLGRMNDSEGVGRTRQDWGPEDLPGHRGTGPCGVPGVGPAGDLEVTRTVEIISLYDPSKSVVIRVDIMDLSG